MKRIYSSAHLYGRYISVILRSTMQYKFSFFLMVTGRFILAFNGFLGILFLFSGFSTIREYTYGDILLCFSVIQMSFAFAECIGSGLKALSGMIRRGEFDRILLRPRSPILQVLGTKFELGRLGPMITSVLTLIIGILKSQAEWNFGKALVLAAMIAGGTVLFLALFILGASFCFFSIEDGGILNILTYGAKEHGKYPVDIYGKRFLQVCTYIIPYAMIQYYPLQYLLGKTEHWQYGLYPLASIVFLAVCYLIWLLGLKNYKSCGN